PSPTNPMRIDYFSIMRKWHVGLYRYGLRMTYDIAIPEPGAGIRKLYSDLDDLKQKIGPFNFGITHEAIAKAGYEELQKFADEQAAVLPPPIESKSPLKPCKTPDLGDGKGWHFVSLEFEVPPDYQITTARLFSDIGAIGDSDAKINPWLYVETTSLLHR